MANALLANAPIREINKSSFGIVTARPAKRDISTEVSYKLEQYKLYLLSTQVLYGK